MTNFPPLLEVENLSIDFAHRRHESLQNILNPTGSELVKNISFSVEAGETVALVGESGSGKSISALSIVRLLEGACYPSGHIRLNGEDLLSDQEKRLQEIRGRDVTLIFQEPMTSLNPLHTIEHQISEIILLHNGNMTRK